MELTIGLAVFVVGYGIISWLMPGGILNPDDIPSYEMPDIPDPDPLPTPGGGGGSTAKACTAFSGWISDGNLNANGAGIKEYYLNIPQGAKQNTPVIIYLHGGGENGESTSPLMNLASVKELISSSQFISIIPHAISTGNNNEWRTASEDIKDLVNGTGLGRQVGDKLASCGGTSDRDKYIMGMSDGANATWTVVQAYNNLFKVAVPVAGPGPYVQFDASKYSRTRVVGVVGSEDPRITEMRDKINKINDANPSMSPVLVVYNGESHDTITGEIKYGQLFNCMLSSSNSSLACATFINSGK